MWPPFFPHPPTPPPKPEPPPIELGRCRYCQSYTERTVVIGGLELAFCCPRSECMKDHAEEMMP